MFSCIMTVHVHSIAWMSSVSIFAAVFKVAKVVLMEPYASALLLLVSLLLLHNTL